VRDKEQTFPENWERVLTNSVGYVINLDDTERNQLGTNAKYDLSYASTAPAVAPAILSLRNARVNSEKEPSAGVVKTDLQ